MASEKDGISIDMLQILGNRHKITNKIQKNNRSAGFKGSSASGKTARVALAHTKTTCNSLQRSLFLFLVTSLHDDSLMWAKRFVVVRVMPFHIKQEPLCLGLPKKCPSAFWLDQGSPPVNQLVCLGKESRVGSG